ncbi:RNI-like protein [Mycena pura]|uniref:RNI-like protein n=1 Tax=Mycena pura TaxID=153505 RepID=A0AAD6YQ42_9AGAR|nr:RNI-like protein [Mycena pura]
MPPKRRRTSKKEFGAPTEDDLPSAASGTSDLSSAPSTRPPRYTTVPTLTALCSRVFAENYVRLRGSEPDVQNQVWPRMTTHLKALPDNLLPRLLADLVRVCPTFLTSVFLSAYFFRGPSLSLNGSLPGVDTNTIQAIARMHDIRDLELSGLNEIPDNTFAAVLPCLPALKSLVLRGCLLVGTKTAAAAASCPQLQVLNLNYTAVTPSAFQPILLACPHLEVVKLAGIPNWTDINVAKMFTVVKVLSPDFSLPKLRTLKLCRLNISEVSLNSFLPLCPALCRLDISFTAVRHPLLGTYSLPTLEKLYLTSTSISNADLNFLLPRLSALTSLALGALGASPRSIAAIDSSMTLTDSALLQIIPHLQSITALTNLSLVGNTKLGSSLAPFIATIGRTCKWLNLSGIPGLRSRHLAGLVADGDEAPARLETLILNNTGIDDDAAPFFTACPALVWLELAETKITSEGLFTVLDGCPQLATLGLTRCRGVRVGDRRRFFEVWEENRASK